MTLARSPYSTSKTIELASRVAKPFFLRTLEWLRTPAFLRVPVYAYLGATLNLLAWVFSWARIGPWAYTFFPLWFGFILALDGVNVARTGTSLLTRSPQRFALLFLISMPFWWAFEILNIPVQNWHYRLDHTYSWLGYHLISSVDFSTVLPAVLEMAELLAAFAIFRPRLGPKDPGPRVTGRTALTLTGIGALCIALAIILPRYAFGLVWLCLAFLLDPINNRAGRKSALGHLLTRDWRFFLVVPLAALCCGFFWEMWNYWALPGWYYTVPFVDAAPHLFEMPLPGYTGYLPFGVELFAMYQFTLLLLRRRNDRLVL
jgi:hypothetical protein